MTIHKNFHSIEGLRAWMAWWVVVGHAIHLGGPPAWLPEAALKFLVRGDTAVNVFIIVSGFVICHLRITSQEPYRDYIGRRFLRLAPVYATCLALAVVTAEYYRFAYVDLPFATESTMRMDRIAETEAHPIAHWLAHATMLHGLVPVNVLPYAGTSILGPAWSLSLEWQFYLTAPIIVGVLALSNRWLAIGTIGMIVVAFVSRKLWGDYYQYSSMLLLSLQFFVIGIVSRLSIEPKYRDDMKWTMVLVVCLLALASRWPVELTIWFIWYLFVRYEAGLINPASIWGNPIGKTIRVVAINKVISHLGRWSYSTYLVHIPLFSAMVFAFVSFAGPTSNIEDLRQHVHYALAIGMIALVPLSWLLYRLVEKPGIRVGALLFGSARRKVTVSVPL